MSAAVVRFGNRFPWRKIRMSNTQTRILVVVSALVCLFLAGASVMAQNPGTAGDPLVSKSYIDHFLRFRSIVLPANAEIKPESGAMIVVRSGQLRLEAPKGKSVIDLTAGREIDGGKDLPLNHLLIIPDSGEYLLKARNMVLMLASCLTEDKQP